MLQQYLPSVCKYSISDESTVYVADNGSTDDSVEFLKKEYPQVELVLFDQNHGYADGYNLAIAQIDAEYIVLLNSDVEVTENWLSPLVDYMDANPKIAACQSKILSYNDKTKFEYASNDLDMDEHTIVIDNRKLDGFVFYKNDVPFNMKNSSSGSKQIGSIQMLLDNNQLVENDFLIIDEPEVNLHPEWQIELAELLVQLVKDFNITVYINSHSPQFIEALEVFSVKYEIDNDTRFYMTVKNKDNGKFDFKEVHYSNIGEFYQQLAKPYDIINEVRLENNLKDL